MRRRPHGQFQRGAGGAVPEPWRGRGAAGCGAGAVARNHAGRGSRCDRVQGEGGGAERDGMGVRDGGRWWESQPPPTALSLVGGVRLPAIP